MPGGEGADEAGGFSAEALEDARKFFAGPVEFLLGAAGLDQLPPGSAPEVAFAGRSNVGKSSLLNALAGQKALARISHTPGRTRQINYFRFGPLERPRLYVVDLPGYGYARASKSEVEAWTGLVRDYLTGRANLRRVMLLIDSRHPIKPNDLEIMKMLDKAAVSYQIVLTKIDKLKTADRPGAHERALDDTKALIARHPDILVTSARKKLGIQELRATLHAMALGSEPGYR